MRFALVDGVRSEATPGSRAWCAYPCCQSELIAKCGRFKAWHWAHKSRANCDPWWESETAWHRQWKDRFPADWQEVVQHDEVTGEAHIADVRNPDGGLVVEFQHSAIHPGEVRSRESFYKNMVWVVDGSRGSDAAYFRMGVAGPIQESPLAYLVEWWGRSKLLQTWSSASTKVFLDFGQGWIWWLERFDAAKRRGVVVPTTKETFVEDCIAGTGFRYLDGSPDPSQPDLAERLRLPQPLVEVRR